MLKTGIQLMGAEAPHNPTLRIDGQGTGEVSEEEDTEQPDAGCDKD
jgi:hypothetical protein